MFGGARNAWVHFSKHGATNLIIKMRGVLLFSCVAALLGMIWVLGGQESYVGDGRASPVSRQQPAEDQPAPALGRNEGELLGERSSSSVKSDPVAAGLARVYGATSYTTLLRYVSELGPDFALDAHDLLEWADHLCSVQGALADGVGRTYEELYEYLVARGMVRAHPEVEASYLYVNRMQSSYCDVGTSNVDRSLWQEKVEKKQLLGSQSPDYARLLEAEKMAADPGAESLVSVAVDIATNTNSPAVFKEAADKLAASGWLPPGYQMPGFAHDQQQLVIRELGGILSQCSLTVNGCAAGSLMAIRFCMPSDCRPGESVQQFLARNHTPGEFHAAQAYAQALLAMRRRR